MGQRRRLGAVSGAVRIHAASRAPGGGRILFRRREGTVSKPSVRPQDVQRRVRLPGALEGRADGVEGREWTDRLAKWRACAVPRAARVSGRGLAGGDAQDRSAGGGGRGGGGRSAEARVRQGRPHGRRGGTRHRGAASGARQRVRESGFGGRVPGGIPSGLPRAAPAGAPDSGAPAHPSYRGRRERHLLRGGAVGLEHHRYLPLPREGTRAGTVVSRNRAHGTFAELERREHDDERHPCAAAGWRGVRGVSSADDRRPDATRPVWPSARSAAARRGGDVGRARLPPAVRDHDSGRRAAERALRGGGTTRPPEADDGRGHGYHEGTGNGEGGTGKGEWGIRLRRVYGEHAGQGERVGGVDGRSVARR